MKSTRRINGIEFPVKLPPPPEWLRAEAVTYYNQIGKLLVKRGVMGDLFAVSLATLADLLAEYIDASKAAATAPETAENTRNVTTTHPAHKRKGAAWDRLVKMLREFGLTPASLGTVKGNTIEGGGSLAGYRLPKGIPQLRIADEYEDEGDDDDQTEPDSLIAG